MTFTPVDGWDDSGAVNADPRTISLVSGEVRINGVAIGQNVVDLTFSLDC